MLKKILFLYLIFSLSFLNSYAQKKLTRYEKKRLRQLTEKIIDADKKKKIEIYDEIAEIYLDTEPDKSVQYIEKAFKLMRRTDVPKSMEANLYNSMGAANFYLKKYRKAIKYYEKELDITKKGGSPKKIAESYYNLATIYSTQERERNTLGNKDKKAIKYYQASLNIAKKQSFEDLQILNYQALFEIFKKEKKYKDALTNFMLYISLKDSKLLKKSKWNLSVLRRRYKVEKKLREEAEDEIILKDSVIQIKDSTLLIMSEEKLQLIKDTITKAAQIKYLNLEKNYQNKLLKWKHSELLLTTKVLSNQRKVLFLTIGIAIIVMLSSFWLFKLYRKIKQQNIVLETQKDKINTQRTILEEKNIQITDSINYAKRIQNSILTPENEIKKYLPEMFVYYEPKDIVSGDFYWFSKIENKYIIAAIDCTGHGVPGAFLSMIGNTLLHEIVNVKLITKPDLILSYLHSGVLNSLNQANDIGETEDGMDMSLCTIDTKQQRFQFAGAKNHLYVVQKNQLKVLKANHYSIGGKPLRPGMDITFSSYDFMYDQNTSIYLFSDGYIDQFGGIEDSKFNTQRFKELLIKNQNLTMEEQKHALKNTMNKWIGKKQQIDDMLVVGIKLPLIN